MKELCVEPNILLTSTAGITEMEELRAQIDSIDSELLKLLAQRLEVAKKIGEYKRAKGLPVRDQKREDEIIEKRSKEFALLGQDAELIKKLWPLLFEQARKVQK